jgi:hypothetical protein
VFSHPKFWSPGFHRRFRKGFIEQSFTLFLRRDVPLKKLEELVTKDDLDPLDCLGGVPPISGLGKDMCEARSQTKSHEFTYVALVSEILFIRTLYHLFQHLVVDIAQLERRSLRVEPNAIEDMRKSGTANVSDSFGRWWAAIWLLFVLSPFGRASDVLSSFCDRWAHDRMVRVPEIQTLVAEWLVSDEGTDERGVQGYPQACIGVFSRVIPEPDKRIPPRTILKDVSDKWEVDL